MFEWQINEGVPADQRIGDLSVSVLGGDPVDDEFADDVHVGSAMKFKAHETLVMCRFAVFILDKYPGVPHWATLRQCGGGILEFYDSLKRLPFKVPDDTLPYLHDVMFRTLVSAEEARIHHVPKFHFAGHLVQRTSGN
eukprot:6462946-Pyramimonas_sp.AAC.1